MKKQEYKIIATIMTLIVLIGGTSYYITETGSKTGCRAGWQDTEENYQSKCVTSSGERFETCFEVYDSANTENYWCISPTVIWSLLY